MCGGGPEKPKMTSGEKALRQVAMKEWEIHQEYFSPMQDRYLDNVAAMNRDEFKNDVAEVRGAGIQSRNSEQVGSGLNQALMNGVDPNSKRFDTTSKALSKAAGLNHSAATTGAMIEAERMALGGKMNAIAIGQGKSADAQVGFTNIAHNGYREEQQRVADAWAQSNNNIQAVGKAGGIVAGVYQQNGLPANGSNDASIYDSDAGGYGAMNYPVAGGNKMNA